MWNFLFNMGKLFKRELQAINMQRQCLLVSAWYWMQLLEEKVFPNWTYASLLNTLRLCILNNTLAIMHIQFHQWASSHQKLAVRSYNMDCDLHCASTKSKPTGTLFTCLNIHKSFWFTLLLLFGCVVYWSLEFSFTYIAN